MNILNSIKKTDGMTDATIGLFRALAGDANNWHGEPLIDITPSQRGNLTDLKKRGLINTYRADGCDWCQFTCDGELLAKDLGFDL